MPREKRGGIPNGGDACRRHDHRHPPVAAAALLVWPDAGSGSARSAGPAQPTVAPFVNDTRTYGDERDRVQPLDQTQLQGIQSFREAQGFDPSEALIRSLYADKSQAVVRDLALYTSAEAAKLDKRLELEQDEA